PEAHRSRCSRSGPIPAQPWAGLAGSTRPPKDVRPSPPLARLEQLDRIARWVLEQDLRAAGPLDDLVAEPNAGSSQPLDLRVDVVDEEVNSIPAARLRPATIGHRPPGRARRTA